MIEKLRNQPTKVKNFTKRGASFLAKCLRTRSVKIKIPTNADNTVYINIIISKFLYNYYNYINEFAK